MFGLKTETMKSRITAIGILAAVMIIIRPGAASAEWPNLANENLPISVLNQYQRDPQIIRDGTGGAIIVWWDTGLEDIYAQHVNSNGVPLWAMNGVAICDAADAQRSPQLVTDGAGGAIITWQDHRSGSNTDIYAQRVNSNGVTLWMDNGVVVSKAVESQTRAKIISDGAGGAIIAWEDERGGALADIYAQRVNAAGAVQWVNNGVVVSDTVNLQSQLDMVGRGTGGAYITWQEEDDIYIQGINSSGNIVWPWSPDGVAVCQAGNFQYQPKITNDSTGGIIISWTDQRSLGEYDDIYSQRVNSDGVMQWLQNGIAVCNAANNQKDHEMVSDGAGGVIIAWSDHRSGSFAHIYAQRINAAGLPLWLSNGIPVSILTGLQGDPDITIDNAGRAVITWVHRALPISSSNLYAQRLSRNGLKEWLSSGVTISSAVGDQTNPRIVRDGTGGAIITWEDMRNGIDLDIYAQRVFTNGTLKAPSPLFFPIKGKDGKVSVIYLE